MLPKGELVRVALGKDGSLRADAAKKLPGRGAYVCRDAACRTKLKKTRALSRAFKREVGAEVYERVESLCAGGAAEAAE
jgi:predicted RNA-binding protein YlxR (DUF448 family)